MKRVGNLMESIADMDNLLMAFWKAQRGKQCKHEVVRYRDHLLDNLLMMRQRLLDGNVKVGRYRLFTISDPKQRQICAAAFDERVLHHALMNVCHPYFDRQLIHTSYATRLGKGTYAALDRARQATARYAYVAKLDVRKYFDSISHEVLKQQLHRIFKDEKLLNVFARIVESYHVQPDCGLPIGNLTSQYFANQYLAPLDHYAKEQLGIQEYVRYMDDILLFSDDRLLLKKQVFEILGYASEMLRLEMKPPTICSCRQGYVFLGYRLKPHVVTLSGRSRRRFARKIFIYGELLKSGQWNEREYYGHVTPLLAYTRHGYARQSRNNILQKVGNRRAITA